VNTHRVVFDDVVLRNLVGPRHGSALAVTVSAEHRDVHYRRRCAPIGGRQDIVAAVAVGATWRHRIAFCHRDTMQTPAMRSRLTSVAIVTHNSLKVLGMPPALAAREVIVTFNTRHVGMRRCRDHPGSDIHRYFRVSTKTSHLRIVVTLEAPGVFLGQRRTCGKPEDRCGYGQRSSRPVCEGRSSDERSRKRRASHVGCVIVFIS